MSGATFRFESVALFMLQREQSPGRYSRREPSEKHLKILFLPRLESGGGCLKHSALNSALVRTTVKGVD